MSDRLGRMSDDELELRLADLATVLAFPPTPDLAATISSRLREPARAAAVRPRLLPFPRTVRRSLLLAAVLALLVVGGAFAVRFGLELLSIERAPLPTTATAPASASGHGAPGAGLDLGRRLALEQAAAAAGFDVLVPQEIGRPDAVYLGAGALRGQVAFVYMPRNNLPEASLLRGAALLVTQNRGSSDAGLAHKIADTSDATVELVDVDGAPGVWISGEPHLFWYLAPDGSFINESRRLVGNTLAWERGGILYRIEGEITLSRALDIARSMR